MQRPFRTAAICCLGFAVSCLSGCRSTPPPKPLEQLTPLEADGHVVFQTNCARCHYDRQTGPLNGPSLMGLYKKPYLPSGAPANDERVAHTVQHGLRMMPPQPQIDDQQMQALLAYLRTL